MPSQNRLSRSIGKLGRLPAGVRNYLVTLLFTRTVRFAGTGGCEFLELAEGRAVLRMKNRRRVQNHIGGIHAAGMALLAETATGAAFGMSVPDTHLPLLKSMRIDYVKRAQGALRAEATLSAEQRQRIASEPKGDLAVPVKVTDAAGVEPIRCEMVWAWVPRKRD